jgi:sRNA-binding protein
MKHTTTTTYQLTREDKENVVRMLVENYPKCFFDNPRQRRPLKKNIADDIIADKNFQVADELIVAALDWYESNIGYSYALANAGATRIDLNGNVANVVTPLEASKAQQIVNDFHKKKNEQASNPVEVLNRMHADGKISDDGVKQLDAIPTRTKAAQVAPEFTQLYETLTSANAAVPTRISAVPNGMEC